MVAPTTGQSTLGGCQSNMLQNNSFPPLIQYNLGEKINLPTESASLPNVSRSIISNYANTLTNHNTTHVWTEEEANRTNILKDIQYAVIGKISYGLAGVGRTPHHLTTSIGSEGRFHQSNVKSIYYILAKDGYSYSIRPLIYDVKFKVEEETT
ncbi:hypothetical protein H5410_045432 [Solanum commersonii]|uniref:Uncharacterized protein n=1 Tax=Solanum commersonii TaxID=4109 RepID=A0A9J5XCP0_SOLCO|nr:hypothetical protein H5410_045432 [Solanum commersonii]